MHFFHSGPSYSCPQNVPILNIMFTSVGPHFHIPILRQSCSMEQSQSKTFLWRVCNAPFSHFWGVLPVIIWIWRTIWSACSAFLPFIPTEFAASVTSSVRSEAARQLLSERRFVWDWPALRQPKSPYTGNNRFLQLQATYLFVIIIFILKIVNLI